jgi:hypothetical protein
MANAGILGPIAKRNMAMDVIEELSWRDMPLCRVEHYRAPDNSSTTRIKFNNFSRARLTAIGNKMKILYPGIRITMEV